MSFLEAGRGKAPQGYVEYAVMKEMGWSYQELMECPAEVIRNIISYMNTEAKFYKARQ